MRRGSITIPKVGASVVFFRGVTVLQRGGRTASLKIPPVALSARSCRGKWSIGRAVKQAVGSFVRSQPAESESLGLVSEPVLSTSRILTNLDLSAYSEKGSSTPLALDRWAVKLWLPIRRSANWRRIKSIARFSFPRETAENLEKDLRGAVTIGR